MKKINLPQQLLTSNRPPPCAFFVALVLSCGGLMGATTLSDPTRPPDYQSISQSPTSVQQLQLSAVFDYPHFKVAIINGQAVKEGDHLGEYTVTTIHTNTVELLGPQSRTQTLELVATVKQPN